MIEVDCGYGWGTASTLRLGVGGGNLKMTRKKIRLSFSPQFF
jgi:hypothetical protein